MQSKKIYFVVEKFINSEQANINKPFAFKLLKKEDNSHISIINLGKNIIEVDTAKLDCFETYILNIDGEKQLQKEIYIKSIY